MTMHLYGAAGLASRKISRDARKAARAPQIHADEHGPYVSVGGKLGTASARICSDGSLTAWHPFPPTAREQRAASKLVRAYLRRLRRAH